MRPLSPQVEFGGLSQSCGSAADLAPQKQRTKPLIPEMCFTSTGCSTDINLCTPYLEEDGTSLLVSCKKCSVRVHASECLSPSLQVAPWGRGLLIEVLASTGSPEASPVPSCRGGSCVLGELVVIESEFHAPPRSMISQPAPCCPLGSDTRGASVLADH